MTAAAILELLMGILGAAPQLVSLFQQAMAGKPVAATDVNAILSQYGLDRAILAALIAKSEAAAGLTPPA